MASTGRWRAPRPLLGGKGRGSANRWSLAALALAVCASVALLFLPIYTQGHESSQTDAAGHVTNSSASSSETLLEGDGSGEAAILLVVPIVIAAAPGLLKSHARIRMVRTLAALMLLPILPIGYFTIGGFYMPSAVAMFIAATRRDARVDEHG